MPIELQVQKNIKLGSKLIGKDKAALAGELRSFPFPSHSPAQCQALIKNPSVI